MGESFFIPLFLLYSGMITDPFTFVKSPQTLIMAAGITVVAYVSKLMAAWIAGKIFHYTRDEFWTVYGLSHAQAAVTIPTLVIGLQTGLFDTNLFNAAILMILLTSITSPLLVQRFAPRLQQAEEEDDKPAPLQPHPGANFPPRHASPSALFGCSAGKNQPRYGPGAQCSAR